MRLKYKHIIFLFLAGFISSNFMQAQEKRITEKSEIVMTQSELDSLLAKLAKRKKEQLAKEKKRSAALSSEMTDDKEDVREEKSSESDVSDRIDREFDRLHRRMDFLIMNMNNSQPVVYGGNSGSDDQARMIYNIQPNQGQPVVPGAEENDGQPQQQPQSNLVPGQQSSSNDEATEKEPEVDTAGAKETAKLQKQINDMSEQLRVLDTLGTMSKSG